MTLVALAPGKVNLCLFLGWTRADGLHPLVSVVQPVSLADELRLGPAPAGATEDVVECPQVPGPNLAGAALAAYRAATGWSAAPVLLRIDKRVPIAAGMGGGSGDAAAALRLAAHAAGRPGDARMQDLAPGLGADVPSQIEPRRVLMTGAGEDVEPLEPGPPMALVILPSAEQLSTPDVFREADRLGLARSDDELRALHERLRAALAGGAGLPDELAVNDLEPAARSLRPSIDAALERLRAAGARHAMVSGSGPTVFGRFAGREQADAAAAELPGAVVAEPVGPEFAAVREA